MRKFTIISALLLSVCAASYAQKVRFMPQWYPQSQFAGYYVAQEKGFFADEGLDVEFVSATKLSPQSVMKMMEDGEVDIINMQLIPAMINKAGGADLINILQTSHNSSLICVSDKPFNSFSELNGKRVAQCSEGLAEPADIMSHDMGLDIEWIYSENATNLFFAGAVDAVLLYSFNEFLSLLFAKGEIPENCILRFSEKGYNFPEDGLYATSAFLQKRGDVADRFVRASMKGWDYVAAHQDEAVDIVMKYAADAKVMTNRTVQKMMLKEILALQVNPHTGRRDFSYIDKDVFDVLLNDMLTVGYIDKPIKYENFVR